MMLNVQKFFHWTPFQNIRLHFQSDHRCYSVNFLISLNQTFYFSILTLSHFILSWLLHLLWFLLWRIPPFHNPLLFSLLPSTHTDPRLSTPMAGPLSLVRGLAVRPSPVSAAAVISSGPSGGLLLTSQAWDRVTSSLNMMGLNQQCVRLNREERDQTT